MSLGTYPNVGLKMARARAEEARALLLSDVHPSAERKQERAQWAQQIEVERLQAAELPLPGMFEYVRKLPR